MADLFKNARSALQEFFLGRRQTAPVEAASGSSDRTPAVRSPLANDLATALETLNKGRLLELLRPQPGLAAALQDMQRAGLLRTLIHEPNLNRGIGAVESLEKLRMQTSVSGERFGSMLRELDAPELLTLALLLSDNSAARNTNDPKQSVRDAQRALDILDLSGDARQTIEFLLRNQVQMSLIAFGQDTSDPSVIGKFVELFSTEDRLKMLCLMTVADLSASGPDALTPWKAELLWRLFVDTYNHMTMTYGDEVIDTHEAALSTLNANRPHDISEAEMAAFLKGLPRRYLTLFEPEQIYRHVRLARDIKADDVHYILNKKSDVWELTVITLDKPYLFSNVCGVLSYVGFDIMRGHALTSRSGLIVDVVQFSDRKGCLVRPQLDPLLSDAVAGRADISAMLREQRSSHALVVPLTPPVVYFDNESSPRYTILELVADDAPGLLHRISRIISERGCAVDLVLISTEGDRAIDVFHLRKGESKLNDSDELALTEDFERMFAA
jgi:[protein-PII] uridylyltransferase